MLSEKRFLTRFFLVNLCLIIPVLLVSILAVGVVTGKMKKLEEQATLRQLNNVLTELEQSYSNYYEESILLSEMEELLPYNIAKSVKDTREGIDVLQMKRHFDNRISNVFLGYGTESVYSSDGVSSKRVHFKSVLGCREESIARGLAVMESGEEYLTFLFKSDTVGYMMYSYPTREGMDGFVSVNFVVPFEQVREMFSFSNEKQWYQLQAKDGSILAVSCDALGNAYVLSQQETENRINNGRYNVFEETLYSQGMVIRLYYEDNFSSLDSGVYQIQLLNMILIVLGIMFSAMVSWFISKRRMNEILRLENIAKGDYSSCFTRTNAYSHLQDIIINGLNASEELERSFCERETKLRDKTAYMIFHGMTNNINEAFLELGFQACPEYFFVGAVSAETRLNEGKLSSVLNECLHVHVIHESLEVVVFLYGLESGDGNRVQRRKIAGDIRNDIHQMGVGKVRIGMSQVYTDPLMIDCAYREALSVLDHVVNGGVNDFCCCWERVVREVTFFLPDASALQKLTEALHEKDFKEAKKQFYHILHGCRVNECTAENRVYIRYAVVQRLVEYLNEENTVENTVFLKQCLNIDMGDEREFAQSVINIMKHCLETKEEDNFARMIKFIEHNYGRSDLTYEEVAAVGGVNKTYVSKLFRTRLGMSYIEYLTAVRMERTATLLRTTDYSINDIVRMVGYLDSSSFRRCFKEKYGISAADYRKRERRLQDEQ